MYRRYKCSISQDEDDDDDDHDDFLTCVPGGLLFLSPVMYPKYKCSISEDEDDDDDEHDDDQCSIQSINVVSKV